MWAGDTRKRLLANVSAYGGDVVLVTITAPGRDQLGSDAAMRRWNRSFNRRWSQLHRAARQAALRECKSAPNLLTWTCEYQKRGALHKHLVMGVNTAAELHAAHRYVHHLARLRHQHRFGFVDRGRRTGGRRALEIITAERAARYVAKYLSPLGADGKPTLSETVTREDVPRMVVYVSNKLTLETGVTMRWLRYVRKCYVLRIDPITGEILDQEQDANQLQPIEFAHSGPPDL